MYTEKNGPNNKLIKKVKNQIICSTNVNGGTHKKPIDIVIKVRNLNVTVVHYFYNPPPPQPTIRKTLNWCYFVAKLIWDGRLTN